MAAKKLVLQDFINRAAQSKKDKHKVTEVFVPGMDGSILVEKIDDELLFGVMDKIVADMSFEDLIAAYEELIYHSCKVLHSPELQKEIDVAEPFGVVRKIFTYGEIQALGDKILKLNGLNEEKLGSDLKN